jgi:hypothetical protein
MDTLGVIYRFTLGTSVVAQLIQVFLLVYICYYVLLTGKGLIDAVGIYGDSTTYLLPDLYDGTQVIYQDPNLQGAITLYPSVNAPSGLEFSYSCFLLINSKTFQGTSQGLRHIFHKGTATYKPLMCPGVFVRNDTNSLVVYMNEVSKWNAHCELPNIPIGKFFHLAIIVRNMAVDIYINGNVTYRMMLSSVPLQNFENVCVFSSQQFDDSAMSPDNPFTVLGSATGFISRLLYTGYALNYEQIDRMVRMGPSTKLVSATQSLPPYLADDWWVNYTAK